MTKRQLIDDIRRYNVTAEPTFLMQFDETALKQYLDTLESARQKHVRSVVYIGKHKGNGKLRMVS